MAEIISFEEVKESQLEKELENINEVRNHIRAAVNRIDGVLAQEKNRLKKNKPPKEKVEVWLNTAINLRGLHEEFSKELNTKRIRKINELMKSLEGMEKHLTSESHDELRQAVKIIKAVKRFNLKEKVATIKKAV